MTPGSGSASSIYIHRRIVVRFLVVMLVVLSALSFASIGLGWWQGASADHEDFGTPTQLADKSPFYVLLIGSDSLEGTSFYSGDVNDEDALAEQHADALVLARVDPGALTITLVTVPANTVLYDSDDPVRDSLSDGGPIQAVYTVERITGVDVRYYFMLDFSGFEAVVNQVGKLNADVPVTIRMQDPVTAKTVTVKEGDDRKLDGAAALAFVRAWDPYTTDVDAHRQLNVRNLVADMIGQVLASDDDKVRKVLGTFEQNCSTDIDNAQLISLVTHFYDNKESVQIYACTGPYLATTIGVNGEPIIRQPASAWRELMTAVDSGEDPAKVFPQYDFDGDYEPEVEDKR